MQRIVLDTNCLLMSLPRISPYRIIWDMFLESKFMLCVSTEIIEEYSEIISKKTTSEIANNIECSKYGTGHPVFQIQPYTVRL